MAQSACFTPLFTLSDFVYPSVNSLPVSKVTGQWVFTPARPFIPYAGAILNANGVYTPDTPVNNITQIGTFVNFFKECRQASINMVQEVAGSTLISDMWQGYLYKQTFDNPQRNQRFLQNAGIVFDFWNALCLALYDDDYFDELNNLIGVLIRNADKGLYIPPGTYTIANGTALALALDAWKLVNPNFVAMQILEFYQSN